jgi:hypothetical protein
VHVCIFLSDYYTATPVLLAFIRSYRISILGKFRRALFWLCYLSHGVDLKLEEIFVCFHERLLYFDWTDLLLVIVCVWIFMT